jgi:hypothetical protein
MATNKNQSHHDRLVKHVYDRLIDQGFDDVRADLPRFIPHEKILPEEIDSGDIPDVTARHYGLNIYEVETDDSIFDQHTEKKWRLFAAFAREQNGRFWVVVPSGCGDSAERRLKELEILANIMEVSVT